MSSLNVRNTLKTYLATALPTERLIDLTGKFDYIEDVILDAGLDREDPWLGIEFIGNSEEPITVPAENAKGKFREFGAFMFHVAAIPKLNVAADLLPRAEALRNNLRGRRIGDIVIESVTPPNFGLGATIDFEGGYTSCTVMVSYYADLDIV